MKHRGFSPRTWNSRFPNIKDPFSKLTWLFVRPAGILVSTSIGFAPISKKYRTAKRRLMIQVTVYQPKPKRRSRRVLRRKAIDDSAVWMAGGPR